MNRLGRYRGHLLLIGVLLLYWFVPQRAIEQYYSGWIFLKFHALLYWVFSWLPFPGFYIIVAAAAITILKWIWILFSKGTFGYKISRITGNAAKWIVWYFILWGFNYGRIPLEEKLALNIRPLTKTELLSEIDAVSKELSTLRVQMERDTVPIPEAFFQYQTSVNDKLAYTINQWGYRSTRVKGRELKEDILLRFDVGGQYMPYTGEANIDAGVHYYSKPYYMVHEMCHANGFTDEASCNFMAYATSFNFNDKGFQYSAQINYFRYLLGDLYVMDSTVFHSIRNNLPQPLKYDLDLLKRHYMQHTFKTAVIGEAINNFYLKLMGVKEGTMSYNKMVLLVYAWRHRSEDHFD